MQRSHGEILLDEIETIGFQLYHLMSEICRTQDNAPVECASTLSSFDMLLDSGLAKVTEFKDLLCKHPEIDRPLPPPLRDIITWVCEAETVFKENKIIAKNLQSSLKRH